MMSVEQTTAAACTLIRKAAKARIVVVAIDGAGGAGKSTLAGAIRDALGTVSIVRVDDFYRPLHDDERAALDPEHGYRNYFDWERMRTQAIRPLRAGASAKYQPYDWLNGELRGWVEVESNAVIVVDGVYSMRPELSDLVDLALFVNTPRELRLDRMTARGQNATNWISGWMAAEDWYLERTRPVERADLVVAGF